MKKPDQPRKKRIKSQKQIMRPVPTVPVVKKIAEGEGVSGRKERHAHKGYDIDDKPECDSGTDNIDNCSSVDLDN